MARDIRKIANMKRKKEIFMAAIPSWVLLVRGDSGKNVRALQCLLNYRNNNKALTVDGSFGPSVYNESCV